MPGSPATSPRLGIPRIASADTDDVPRDLNAAVDRIDIVAGRFESGLLASRPSAGAGIADRYYFATDDTSGGPSGTLYRDAGGASPTWVRVHPANMEATFSTWQTIAWGGASIPTQGAGGTFLMPAGPTQNAGGQGIAAVGAAGTAGWSFAIDPAADWLAGTRTTKFRIRWECHVNAVAPAQNFVPGLYPASSFGGTSGTSPTTATLGTLITGSTPTVGFTAPGAGSYTVTLSSEFNAPATGPYVFGLVIGGGMAAGSQAIIKGQLQMRRV